MKPVIRILISGLLLLSVTGSTIGQETTSKILEDIYRDSFDREVLKEIDAIRNKENNKDDKDFFVSDPELLSIIEREIRHRSKDPAETLHPNNLKIFRPIAEKVAPSVYAVFVDDQPKRKALATAVTKDGQLVTKASEIESAGKISVKSVSGQRFEAKVVRVHENHDLALLKIDSVSTPIRMEKKETSEGAFLVSVENSSRPISVGAYSVKPRSIIGKNRGFLGVEPAPHAQGVLINSVTRNSAANRAGIQPGDIVLSIGGKPTATVADLVREIGSRKKGQTIELKILRDEERINLSATLDGRRLNGMRAARFEAMRRLGTILSDRNDEFPLVFQHASPIFPSDCGGPVVDLDGNVIGINIARSNRSATYALPIEVVADFVREH